MGAHVSRTDFEWVSTDEPHAERRAMILKKYPEIKKLYGHEPKFTWKIIFVVLVQFSFMYVMRNRSWPMLFFAGYVIGGVMNHAILQAMHETTHNLVFGHSKPVPNRILGIFANLPIGFPVSVSFKRYHTQHHKYQGDSRLDTDLPTLLEAKLFNTTFGKLVWVIMQPFFYILRPIIVYPLPPVMWEFINLVVQVVFDVLVWYFFGGKAVAYMFISTFITMGLHPAAGHFIAEHYMFKKGFETYSYYGPLNWITFNTGYHVEHHDFPNVPNCRLPEIKRIAGEFYEDLPYHTSWTNAIYQFILDPAIGPYARIKRKHKGLDS